MKGKKTFTVRIGPVALSLVAAAITAIAFAAISVADSGNSSGGGKGVQNSRGPARPGGPGVMFRDNLSAADKQKMEDFRQCMQDNGAPGPPDRSKVGPSDGPPKPPSKADREKVQKAYEACKDKLPEGMQMAGPPRIHRFRCGPPPGAPPKGTEQGQNQNQSNNSGTSSSGSSS
ncbi:MAG: hypothetical protein WBQ41_11280 [Solirubrobacterales bacterium]